MSCIWAWLVSNGSRLFSSIVINIFGIIKTIIKLITGKKSVNIKQTQKSGKNSINIQSAKDITFVSGVNKGEHDDQ